MGFGFGDDGEDDKDDDVKKETIECKPSDTLKWAIWSSLKVGERVRSAHTGVYGNISELDNNYKLLHITWDNGNQSRASLSDLTKVIRVRDKDEPES